MDKSEPLVVVSGYIEVSAGDLERVVGVLQAHILRVREKDGCMSYAFAVDVLDRGIIRMSEVWRDLRSLQAHLEDDEFRGVMTEMAQFEFLGRSVQRYNVASVTEI